MALTETSARIYIPDKYIANDYQTYHYEVSEKDPVIFDHLEDIELENDGTRPKISVEFQTRSESKDDVLIVWEHDDDIVAAKKLTNITHGVTSCKLKYAEDVEGIWTVHIVDLHFRRIATSTCEVTLE